MTACRLIVDPPNTGVWNMAADEYLLHSSSATDPPTLRLYQWSQPTLSLGYFQKLSDRELHASSRHCPVVRRHSGGGAIVHDRELTYSFVVPGTPRWAASAGDLYDKVHVALRDLYNEWAANSDVAKLSEETSDGPFLCFQRRAIGDILIGKSKVTGSAQRRNRNVTLQHGSILLGQSVAAPELPGIEELIEKTVSIEQAVKGCKVYLERELGCELVASRFDDAEKAKIEALADEKFSQPSWTCLLYTSPSPRDKRQSRMPSSA